MRSCAPGRDEPSARIAAGVFGAPMTLAPPVAVETPSGKDAAYENFPVGSLLLPARLRPHVAVFYDFARAIDDIADNANLDAADKVSRLQAFEDVLMGRGRDVRGYEKAARMRDSLDATNVTPRHCADLIAAFKQDATKLRYRDWDELMGYCVLSAAPVGRYLLDLHAERVSGYAAADALCIALQVINHLQDCQDDYRKLDRVYLPGDWMAEHGAALAELDLRASPPGLRAVFDRTLDGVAELLTHARPLPATLQSRRLAMESSAILRIAHRLSVLLRRRDPLASRVQLNRADYLWCCVRGAIAAVL